MAEPQPPAVPQSRELNWTIKVVDVGADGWRRVEVGWADDGDDALIAAVEGQTLAEAVAGAAAALTAFAARIGLSVDLRLDEPK